MSKESQLRTLSERLLQSTLSTLSRRPLPASGHQAAADLYNALDRYADAINHNQLSAARLAAEKLAIETMRVLVGYELPSTPSGVENVRVENVKTDIKEKTKA